MRLSQQLNRQWRHLIAELTKFGVVGGVNTALDFGIFNALHFGAGIGPLTAQACSAVVSTTSSYAMNRHWTFKHRARTGVRREYILFFVLNVIGLLIMEVFIGGARYGLGLSGALWLNVAKAVGVGVSMLFRYWSYKRWVFLDATGSDHSTEAMRADAMGAAVADAVPDPAPASSIVGNPGPGKEDSEGRRAQ